MRFLRRLIFSIRSLLHSLIRASAILQRFMSGNIGGLMFQRFRRAGCREIREWRRSDRASAVGERFGCRFHYQLAPLR
jgi:hypothetical protein